MQNDVRWQRYHAKRCEVAASSCKTMGGGSVIMQNYVRRQRYHAELCETAALSCKTM